LHACGITQNMGVNEGTEASLYRIVVVNKNLGSKSADGVKEKEENIAAADNESQEVKTTKQDSAATQDDTTKQNSTTMITPSDER